MRRILLFAAIASVATWPAAANPAAWPAAASPAASDAGAGAAAAGPAPRAARAFARTPRPDTIRLEDDLGRTVVLPGPARRIVSLIPAATEILFALGAGDRLAGRTRFGVHPPEAADVPGVGDGIRPAAELVVARRPDLVVAYAGAANRRPIEELRRAGLRVLAVRHDRLADLERNVRRLGAATGCAAAAEDLVRRIRRGLEAVRRATAGRGRPAVYYDVWADPPITVGAGSYLDSLLTVAGGRNVFGDLAAPSPQVSLEAIADRDPDIVLVPLDAAAGARRPPPPERPGWGAVGAVRAGRIRTVDGGLVHRLGPRLPESAAELAEAIHPGSRAREAALEAVGGAPAAGGAGAGCR